MVAQTKVFIGSLPQGSRPEDLRRVFEKFGAVTECDIMNRCGFVHMETEEQAEAAIRSLNNTTFNGAVITVEKGRIKPRGGGGGGGGGGRGRGGGMGRGGRGGGGGGRFGGGMRNGMDGPRRGGGGGPMRGSMGGRGGDSVPYSRDGGMRGNRGGRDNRGPPMGGGMRNGGSGGGGYGGGGYGDEQYGGYGDDRRGGFAGGSGGMGGDAYGAGPGAMYDDRRGGYGAPIPSEQPMYPEERAAPMYSDDRGYMDRQMVGGYERAPRAAPMGSGGGGDMFSRREPAAMRGGGGAVGAPAGGYDRDPYAQQYPPMGRVAGGGGHRGGRDMGGMGPRRY